MNYLIKYEMRLGDIVRVLPIAKKLYDDGHSVAFQCAREYHSLFRMVDFCEPCTENSLFIPHKVLDLQVWPKRYDEYRSCCMRWADFVYGIYEESYDLKEQDVFGLLTNVPEVDIPQDVALVCAHGFSQPRQPDLPWLMRKVEELTGLQKCMVLPHPLLEDTAFKAKDIPELAGAIKAAKVFVSIDSGPNALAAAVGRESWYYLPSPREVDNFRHPNQIEIPWF